MRRCPPFADLASLHELHLIAKEYGQDPARLAGIDPREEGWLSWSLRRATFYAGRTVESRLRETRPILAPDPEAAPRGQHWSTEPKWTYAQAVGLEPPPPDADGAAQPSLPELDPDAERLLSEIG